VLLLSDFIVANWLKIGIQIATLLLLIIILQFFEIKRSVILNANHIIAPVDGKVVVIEEVLKVNILKTNVYKFLSSCRL
jgi:phosphatidylserine decarboxylase